MNRRAALFGQKKHDFSNTNTIQQTTQLTQVNSGLEPYAGIYQFEQVAHLLRRSTFGPTYAQIKSSIDLGLETTLDKLFEELPLPSPPLNFDFEDDPFVPVGETWINAPYSTSINLRGYRQQSLRGWTIGNMLNEGISIREKLVLFWHNHFVTAEINDPKFLYRYITLFRNNAWGNFRELTKKITIDPAMLRYLNGRDNSAVAPNENYARELLELFTIGKGPLVGDGDYTYYTEEDVIQIARILTGWRDIGFNTTNPNTEITAVFVPNRHDKEVKQLSHRFDNQVISDMGDEEYAYLIDLIFEKNQVARFIARKLYRWFIYYDITEEAEVNVIEPMAQMLIDNDYEIRPALRALLGSAHFFDMLNVGPMIKNPADFVLSTIRQFQVVIPNSLNLSYRVWWQISRVLPVMQMEIFNPPSVAGWKAYYQEPGYYRIWINSVTLPLRQEVTNILSGEGIGIGDSRARIRPLIFIETLDNPSDPNLLIEDIAKIIFPQPITETQLGFLKEILIPGLPDFEWTVEYAEYLSDPSNEALAMAVENKLRNLIRAMLSMPEFYLS